MGQVLHGSVRTTEALRRAIQPRQESVRAAAKRYGVSPTTVQKWRGAGPNLTSLTSDTIILRDDHPTSSGPMFGAPVTSPRQRRRDRYSDRLLGLDLVAAFVRVCASVPPRKLRPPTRLPRKRRPQS